MSEQQDNNILEPLIIASSPKLKTYICGCVRNCASNLPAVFANIEKITTLYDDYHIVVAYDNSSDQTLRELCEAKRKYDSKMDILINREPLYSVRTQNIAKARNSLMKYIKQNTDKRPDFDYFIMMDFDDVCAGNMKLDVLAKYMDGERNGNPYPWDTLSFNRPGYYDIWALSIDPYVYSCWSFPRGREVVAKMREYILYKLKEVAERGPDELLSCMSSFNGFAIYRIAKFMDIPYEWTTIKNAELIQIDLIHKMVIAVGQPLGRRPHDEDCEHRYFHLKAIQEHGAKICISPLCLFTDLVVC